MIILIAGASHTGKTVLAQKLLERYHYPVLSLDLLKMGLIRSGQTNLTPEDDQDLTPYLWSITSELIKTAIENGQNLIIEGCYIPFTWHQSFDKKYLPHIEYYCLVMSECYIASHKRDIIAQACRIENRLLSLYDDSFFNELIADNKYNLAQCKVHNLPYCFIDSFYEVGTLSIEVLAATNYSDALKAAHLFHDTIHTVNTADYTPAEIDAWSPGDNNHINYLIQKLHNEYTLIAKECGIVVGFGSLDQNNDLDMLYVHKDRQHQNIASKLLSKLEAKAKAQGKTIIQTYASITAYPFFLKQGYVCLKENVVERKGVQLRNYLMQKPLINQG